MSGRMLFETPEALWAAVEKSHALGLDVAEVTREGIRFHPQAPKVAPPEAVRCPDCGCAGSPGDPNWPASHPARCPATRTAPNKAVGTPSPSKPTPPPAPKVAGTPYTADEMFGASG